MASKTRKNFWGLSHESLLSQNLAPKPAKAGRTAAVTVNLAKKGPAFVTRDTAEGVTLTSSPLAAVEAEHDSRLKSRAFARVRDAMGTVISALERSEIEWADINLEVGKEELNAALLGLELALYRYKRMYKGEPGKFRLSVRHKGKALHASAIEQGTVLGRGMNIARHLVNLPPNELNPVTYAEFARGFFSGVKGVKVEVWDEKRLQQENMGLHYGVGQGSAHQPRLVKISYRPAGAKKGPVAFVGKGITFDTGGLDIKPSSGMRLMKKDMGGSASVCGLVYWAAKSGVKQPIDAYLALAENAISADSFRPSDVLTARNGMTVEIHNTDAEGRLVLADAMDVAATAKDKPRALIDVATLTGAIKVALGSQLAGLFSNDSRLTQGISAAGIETGDLTWTMPLYQKYRAQMNSNFADVVNAIDGFGGAVTAALFLEKFARDIPWAHLDIYAWKDSAEGCWLEGGGSGQTIQALATWLSGLK